MNIREVIVPDAYKLIPTESGSMKSVIIDQELDPFNVIMRGDDCVLIDTEEMAYITLSIEDLLDLIKLIRKADQLVLKNNKS
jgi:hypothetical protein